MFPKLVGLSTLASLLRLSPLDTGYNVLTKSTSATLNAVDSMEVGGEEQFINLQGQTSLLHSCISVAGSASTSGLHSGYRDSP